MTAAPIISRSRPQRLFSPDTAKRSGSLRGGHPGLLSPGLSAYLEAGMEHQAGRRAGLADAPWLRIGLGLLAAAALAGFWSRQQRLLGKFTYDDTFITLRYAENLARHGHLSFNLDDRIDGYTSPAWTLLLAAAIASGADGESAALLLSKLWGLLGIMGAIGLARRLGASWFAAAAIAGLGTATTAGWVVWSAPGMETPFVGACVAMFLAAFAKGEPGSRWRAFMLLLTAAARPECVILVIAGLCHDAYRLWQRPTAPGRDGRRRIIAVTVTLVAAFAAHWLYYGAPLPNTFYAKLSGIWAWRLGLKDLGEFLTTHGVGLGFIAALLLLTPWGSAPRFPAAAFISWSAAAWLAYAAAGGDYLEHHRFYQPQVPAAFAMLAALMRYPRRPLTKAPGMQVAAALLTAALGVWLYISGRQALATAWTGYLPGATAYARRCRQVGEALFKAYPPGTSLSIRAAGIIPYLTRFRTFDTLGLNTREVALHPGRVHPADRGHGKEASAAQIVAWQPDLIVNHPSFYPRDESGELPPDMPPEYRAAGYTFACVSLEDGTWNCFYAHPRVKRR